MRAHLSTLQIGGHPAMTTTALCAPPPALARGFSSCKEITGVVTSKHHRAQHHADRRVAAMERAHNDRLQH